MHKLLKDSPGEGVLLLGNEAIARGALEAGVACATCYPGTPSSEIGDNFFQVAKECDLYYEYSTNEIVSLNVAAAASVAGLRSICSMKHVGLNVAADTLITLAYLGITKGLVVVTADDPAMFAGINEQDNRYYGKLASLAVLEPSTAQEAKEFTKYAFELSEQLGEPVILRTTTRVSHLSGVVTLGAMEKRVTQCDFKKEPSKWVPLPAFSGGMHKKLLASLEKAKKIGSKSEYNPISGSGKWGIITSGISYNYVADAVKDLNVEKECRVLKLGLSYPLPEDLILDFLSSCEKVLIVEELEPFVEEGVKVLAYDAGITIPIKGKGEGLFSKLSEYDPALVRNVIASFFGIECSQKFPVDTSDIATLPSRPPTLCSGCPHRASYATVRKVVGDDAIYCNDIGCYALGFFAPLSMADLTISMGSGIATGSGMSQATGKKVISYIGDSTFYHSGIPALANAVFNNHNLTVIILDNGITAMTGLQPSPAGDMHEIGMDTSKLEIEDVVKSLGITQMTTVNPRNVKAMTKAVEECMDYKGVSVIITRDPCVLYAALLPGAKKKTVTFDVDQNKCKKHLNCIKEVACPSMFIDEDGLVQVNAQSCTGCSLCAQFCPEKAIVAKKFEEVTR